MYTKVIIGYFSFEGFPWEVDYDPELSVRQEYGLCWYESNISSFLCIREQKTFRARA
jgi:hypothetical protein